MTQASPAGGSSVTLASNNTFLAVPATVMVGAGATTATFSVTAAANIASNQTATVTATFGSSSQTTNVSLTAPVLVSGLTCSPTSLGQSAVGLCTLILNQPAPSHGSVVTLASGNTSLAVPSLAGVTPGATTATFSATAAASIATNQTATVTATIGGNSQAATINLLAPVVVSSVACSPLGAMSGATVACLITLSQAAPANTTVLLNSSSALLSIPAALTIPAGSAAASAPATAGTILSDTQAIVTATLGASTQNTTVILWSTPSLSSVSCAPNVLAVSATGTCTVTVSKPAGNLTIKISASNAALAVPATVTVPQGSSSTNFTVTGQVVASHGVVVTASYNGVSQLAGLVVTPAASSAVRHASADESSVTELKSISCKPSLLRAGTHGICQIELEAASDSVITDIQLTTSNQSLRLPGAITIEPGQSTASFGVDAISPVSDGAATITAQLGAAVARETVSLDFRHGPLDVPAYQYARFGTPVDFKVSSPDTTATLAASDLPAGAIFDPVSGIFTWVPDASQQGRHSIVFTAASLSGELVTASAVLEVDSGAPVITRIVNAASRSEESACSQGSVGRLEGRWLVEGEATSDPSGESTELSGTTVRINGMVAPILSASRSQVDFLCPAVVPGSTLEIGLQTPANVALPVRTVSRQSTPGIFSIDGSGTGQGMVLHSETGVIAMTPDYRYPSRAALPGEAVTIYATGIEATQRVSVRVGEIEVSPQSISADPELAGVYRVYLILPRGDADDKTAVSLKIQMLDGSTVMSNEVSVATEASQR